MAGTVNPECTDIVADQFLRRIEQQVDEFMSQYQGVRRAPGSYTRERDIARAKRINNKIARLLKQPLSDRSSFRPVSRVRPMARVPVVTPERSERTLSASRLQEIEDFRDAVTRQFADIVVPSYDAMVTEARRTGRVTVRVEPGRVLRLRLPADSDSENDTIIVD
jgi:hypothetical protein